MAYLDGKKLGYVGAMRRFLLAFASVLIPITGWAQGTAENQQATFRSGVDLVTVSTTVRDGRGRLVKDLTQKDFEVLDRGEKRPISEFRSERAPLSLAILFDVSGSMDVADRATAAKFAAFHLISSLEEGRDEAGLFSFDSRLREVAPFTVDTRALKGALGEVDPFGATSLHDAISAAAERVAARPMARRAVVVLTDGVDTASRLTPAQVSAKAAAIDVPVYIIATVLPIDDPGSDRATPGSKRQAPASIGTIEDLSRWTGGALYYASSSASAFQAARAVVDELRHLYLIAFEPGSQPGWHPIEIRTPQKDFVVRTRGGYVAGPAARN
ncbi:MAG TPA: VWA domain-containing protein [Vicinamibacterales bacterium]|nr:VWA domain-containing protein [Vicinamibacterales bacterium]